MCVIMGERSVAVPVTVRACRHRIVQVVVMPVVVVVGMLMLHRVMWVMVAMTFGGMEINAHQH